MMQVVNEHHVVNEAVMVENKTSLPIDNEHNL